MGPSLRASDTFADMHDNAVAYYRGAGWCHVQARSCRWHRGQFHSAGDGVTSRAAGWRHLSDGLLIPALLHDGPRPQRVPPRWGLFLALQVGFVAYSICGYPNEPKMIDRPSFYSLAVLILITAASASALLAMYLTIRH